MLRRVFVVPLVLGLAVMLSYSNALLGVFQFDDYNVIVDYTVVHSWDAWFANLGTGIRPLLKLTYTLNWTAGPGPVGFHVFNIALHAVNALLVYWLARKFGERCEPAHDWHRVALLTALLFAVHPVHTEAVTYISGRSSSLMAMFYFCGLLAYAQFGASHRKLGLYLLSPLLFVLAVGVKETAMTFPFALLIWELGCGENWRRIWRKQAVHWAVFFAGMALLLFHERYWSLMAVSANLHGLYVNILTQINAVVYLSSKLLLPYQLNIDPELPVIYHWREVVPQLILLSACLVLAVFWRRTRPLLSFGVLWLLLHLLLPYVFLPRLDIANERQLYLADWGVFLLVAAAFERMLQARTALISGALVGLCGLTIMRNQVYQSEIALWEDTVQKSPHKARANNNLGYAYALSGRKEEARRAYLAALKLDPDYAKAGNNLAALESQSGK